MSLVTPAGKLSSRYPEAGEFYDDGDRLQAFSPLQWWPSRPATTARRSIKKGLPSKTRNHHAVIASFVLNNSIELATHPERCLWSETQRDLPPFFSDLPGRVEDPAGRKLEALYHICCLGNCIFTINSLTPATIYDRPFVLQQWSAYASVLVLPIRATLRADRRVGERTARRVSGQAGRQVDGRQSGRTIHEQSTEENKLTCDVHSLECNVDRLKS